jgi:uncharacterized BrkB/YihY/UPF0761 family membrane protein
VTVAIALLFHLAPRRRQPAWSWLAFGASVSVMLWSLVTLALGFVFELTNSFGQTYGPLAGMVALLLWALLSSIAVLFGAAMAAQLEAVRAGAPGPRDEVRAEDHEARPVRSSRASLRLVRPARTNGATGAGPRGSARIR